MKDNLTYEIQNLNNTEWNEILNLFDDASIYQTNAFTKYSIGGENPEHFIAKKDSNIIAASQVRLKTIPTLKRGVAYLRWGPLWQLTNKPKQIENFQLALELLYKEYVIKRKLVLRIVSNHFLEEENNYVNIFNQLGYTRFQHEDKTIIIDLTQDEETLRKNFRKKWRYSLKQAEKKELTIVKGNSQKLFDEFVKIYKEMHGRKNFEETVSVDTFKQINDDLVNENKLQIFICKFENKPLSAMVSTAMGNSGIYLLGGSTSDGLKMGSSYLLQWETMKWLKAIGKQWYNLGGIDAEANPGVYTFKKGMGGKEVTFIGGFEASKDLLSKKIVQLGELIKGIKH